MATNDLPGRWSVKVAPISENTSFKELAESLQISKSRIWIPKIQKDTDRYAWINDFANKDEADEFAVKWSGSSIFGMTIKCLVTKPKGDRTDPPHSFSQPRPCFNQISSTTQRKSGFNRQMQDNRNNDEKTTSNESHMSIMTSLTSDLTAKPTAVSLSQNEIRTKKDIKFKPINHRRQVAESSTFKITTIMEKNEDKRPLCLFANKGTCRSSSNDCKYRHERCKNFDSCSIPTCRLGHSKKQTITDTAYDSSDDETNSSIVSYQTRPRNDSCSSMTSTLSINIRVNTCRNGINCYKIDCKFDHPIGWNACSDEEKCENYECTAKHPPKRKIKCRNAESCKSMNCKFLHPNTRAEECPLRGKCRNWNCSKLHPHFRARSCIDGEKCTNFACLCLHPLERAKMLCQTGADCRDSSCKLNHPPERPSVCDQPDDCSNFYCTRLHGPTWNPCEVGDECEDENCSKIHPPERNIKLQPKTTTSILSKNKNKNRSSKCLKTVEKRTEDWQKAQLPILAYQIEFCQRLERERLLIVTAETGSGKSTQLPQYAADYFGSLVVCTQPRAVAALSLANRVAEEFDGQSVGESVGYQVGNAKRVCGTKIMFMTDAALIRESQRDPSLKHIRVLIIDEAHERSLNTDIVIGISKLLLRQRPSDFYVVIASATIDPTRFLQFFDLPKSKPLEVKGRVFPVTCEEKIKPTNCSDQKLIESHIVPTIIELYPKHEGHTLVFLPGQSEIERALRIFKSKLPDDCIAFPLYGSQTPEDQEKVIKFNEKDKRMVVFCTNVAETSLTIANARLVIDSGLAKEARYDVKRRLTVIETVRISRSSADQRKGRAGRTAPGHCVRLYEDTELKRQNIEPEILRSSLDLVLLQLIRLNLDPKTFPFMDQPTSDVLHQSIDLLTKLECINDQKITKRGELFTELALDPRLSSFIIEIYIEYESLLEIAVSIVAILSAPGTIFFMGGSTKEAKQQAKERVALQAQDYKSDLMHLYSVYDAWKNAGAKLGQDKCSECKRQIKYCICRVKHSNDNGLNNKILQNINNSSATIMKQIKKASWLKSGSEMPQNIIEIIGMKLAKFFPEQCGYLLVPQLPDEGVRLTSTDIRANITNTSVFMQKLHIDRNNELYQHFVAMSITQLTSGSYIIEKLHPIPRPIATVQASITHLMKISNIGPEINNCLRQKLSVYQSESWAKWLVYQYDQVNCRFNLWGLESDKTVITSVVQRIHREILNKLSEIYDLLECGPIKANFQSGLICTNVNNVATSLKLELKNIPKQQVNDLKICLKKILDIDWNDIKEYRFYTIKADNDQKTSDEQCNRLRIVFKKEEIYRRAVNKVPPYYLSDQDEDSGIFRDSEKDCWGRELIIDTPANATVEDIVNRYGADSIKKCLQLNKKDGKACVESTLKLNSLPLNIDETFLRDCLKTSAELVPKHVYVGHPDKSATAWAKVTFADEKQRNQAACIYDFALCQKPFSITVNGKNGPREKTVQTTISKDDDVNSTCNKPKIRFRIVFTSREVALRVFSSLKTTTETSTMTTTISHATDTSEWTVDSSATVTVIRTDLYPDFQQMVNGIGEKFDVKVTMRDIPNFGKRCLFNHGSPQKTSLAASMLAQACAPMNIKLTTDRQKQLFDELEECKVIQKWASELALVINKNKYNTNIEIRGPKIAQGQLMRRIADYSDQFGKRFREYQLSATVAKFFGRQKAASIKLQKIASQWSSKHCLVNFIPKTSAIINMGKPNALLTDIDACEKEIIQLLDELTIKNEDEDRDEEEAEEGDVTNMEALQQDRRCVFCKQKSSMSTSIFRICGHAYCRCATQALSTSFKLPLQCTECKSNIHIKDIQIIFNNNEQLLMHLLKSSIQNYLKTNKQNDDRVFCPSDECDGLVSFHRSYQTCLTCGHNVCPQCQAIDDALHMGRTCAQLVEEKKKRQEFLPQLFEAAKIFVRENWPTDATMSPIGRIDENLYLQEQYRSLIRFYKGIKTLGHSFPPDLEKGFFAYHGTAAQAILPICQNGFDPKRRAGQVYGPGEYFGVTASVSHGYSQKGDNPCGSSQIIIAYLLRGTHVNTVQNFCYVINNPTDWTYAFNLPVLVVTYGPKSINQPSAFPSIIPEYIDNEPSWNAPFRWYWRQDSGEYEPYNDKINEILENFYEQWRLHGGPSNVVTPPLTRYLDDVPQTYRIDFKNNRQTNTKTSYTRNIDRRPMEKPPDNQNWFYCDENGVWTRYEALVQNRIEQAFQSYRAGRTASTIDVSFPGRPETYEINFLKGQQTNKTSNTIRNIKRE